MFADGQFKGPVTWARVGCQPGSDSPWFGLHEPGLAASPGQTALGLGYVSPGWLPARVRQTLVWVTWARVGCQPGSDRPSFGLHEPGLAANPGQTALGLGYMSPGWLPAQLRQPLVWVTWTRVGCQPGSDSPWFGLHEPGLAASPGQTALSLGYFNTLSFYPILNNFNF